MPYFLNVLYLLLLFIFSPWLLYKSLTTGKYRRGLWRKFTGLAPQRSSVRPCAWFHGVSVGEIHLLRQVVGRFRQLHPDWDCVISTTTDTGFDEAARCFPDLCVFYWPLDFTWAVGRAMRRIQPKLVVLAEGEIWPNFLHASSRRQISVAQINGRMSPRSFRRYRHVSFLGRWLFGKLSLLAVQTAEYAACFHALGAARERIVVTGSVKYDGVETDRDNPRTQELRKLFNVTPADLVWVAGSTQAPEEQVVLDIFRRARKAYPNLRLFLVPRQKDRFDEVASLLQRAGTPFVRRSQLQPPLTDTNAVVLLDTIGELSALWGFADLAYVGGSLDGKRGGQNMIEPAAYGAAVLFGPRVWNFKDTVLRLLDQRAAVQILDAADLETEMMRLLGDSDARRALGGAAQQFVRSQQGATDRTLAALTRVMQSGNLDSRAA